MTKEECVKACVSGGSSVEAAESTWELMASIERVLNDEDVSRFTAPERILPKQARLARMFIDRYKSMTLEGDKAIAEWLRSRTDILSTDGAEELAKAVEDQVHWKWWAANKPRKP